MLHGGLCACGAEVLAARAAVDAGYPLSRPDFADKYAVHVVSPCQVRRRRSGSACAAARVGILAAILRDLDTIF